MDFEKSGEQQAIVEAIEALLLQHAGAARAIERVEEFKPLHIDPPYELEIVTRSEEAAEMRVKRHNAERGDPPPRLVAHENVLRRYARYRETERLQLRMASVQFPARQPVPLDVLAVGLRLHDPTETFSDRMTLVEGARRVELIWAPSEVDDAIALWFPDDGLLCGGAATPGFTIPNVGTPLRTQRFTIRWAETLEHLAEIGAARLLTEFGPMIEGDEIRGSVAIDVTSCDEVGRRKIG